MPITTAPIAEESALFHRYRSDWLAFGREIYALRLDPQLSAIVKAVQTHRRVAIRSGHARGKDFISGFLANCNFMLRGPSKTILTAPTERQAVGITMSEARTMYKRANERLKTLGAPGLGAEVLTSSMRSPDPDWYLSAFTASDVSPESWTGFHSPSNMVIVSEASGVADEVYDAIEGILTGDSRLVLVGNPHRRSGYFYRAFADPTFKTFRLNCLQAPNVKARRVIYPGQVDYEWVADKVDRPGWSFPIHPLDADPDSHDFEFPFNSGKWHRPLNPFIIKVLGEFPDESEGVLIPERWLEAAFSRWMSHPYRDQIPTDIPLSLGIDVSGMGTDSTVLCHRYGNFISKFSCPPASDTMGILGRVREELASSACPPRPYRLYIDTIGEGAGLYSRAAELGMEAESVKASYASDKLTDSTGQRRFLNMRAYLHWALRDALDPRNNLDPSTAIAIPPTPELIEDIRETFYKLPSDDKIRIEPKLDIRARLKRSPDWLESLILTFFPSESYGQAAWFMDSVDISP